MLFKAIQCSQDLSMENCHHFVPVPPCSEHAAILSPPGRAVVPGPPHYGSPSQGLGQPTGCFPARVSRWSTFVIWELFPHICSFHCLSPC